MARTPRAGQQFKVIADGSMREVIGLAKHPTSGDQMVVFHVPGDDKNLFLREVTDFTQPVDGKMLFEAVDQTIDGSDGTSNGNGNGNGNTTSQASDETDGRKTSPIRGGKGEPKPGAGNPEGNPGNRGNQTNHPRRRQAG